MIQPDIWTLKNKSKKCYCYAYFYVFALQMKCLYFFSALLWIGILFSTNSKKNWLILVSKNVIVRSYKIIRAAHWYICNGKVGQLPLARLKVIRHIALSIFFIGHRAFLTFFLILKLFQANLSNILNAPLLDLSWKTKILRPKELRGVAFSIHQLKCY